MQCLTLVWTSSEPDSSQTDRPRLNMMRDHFSRGPPLSILLIIHTHTHSHTRGSTVFSLRLFLLSTENILFILFIVQTPDFWVFFFLPTFSEFNKQRSNFKEQKMRRTNTWQKLGTAPPSAGPGKFIQTHVLTTQLVVCVMSCDLTAADCDDSRD